MHSTSQADRAVNSGKKKSRQKGLDHEAHRTCGAAPAFTPRGEKDSSVDPMVAQLTSAREKVMAALTAARCWAIRPGLFRPVLRLKILKGPPVKLERPSAVLSICPPPSPRLPSIWIISPLNI